MIEEERKERSFDSAMPASHNFKLSEDSGKLADQVFTVKIENLPEETTYVTFCNKITF